MYINFPVRAIHDERTDAGVDKSRPAALQVRREGTGPRDIFVRYSTVMARKPRKHTQETQ